MVSFSIVPFKYLPQGFRHRSPEDCPERVVSWQSRSGWVIPIQNGRLIKRNKKALTSLLRAFWVKINFPPSTQWMRTENWKTINTTHNLATCCVWKHLIVPPQFFYPYRQGAVFFLCLCQCYFSICLHSVCISSYSLRPFINVLQCVCCCCVLRLCYLCWQPLLTQIPVCFALLPYVLRQASQAWGGWWLTINGFTIYNRHNGIFSSSADRCRADENIRKN